ncbi:hypothetical protein FQN57_003282, partial [Myotisia sp. PD_48]
MAEVKHKKFHLHIPFLACMFSHRRRIKLLLFFLFLIGIITSLLRPNTATEPATSSLVARSWLWKRLSESSIGTLLPSWFRILTTLLVARAAPSVVLRQGTLVGITLRDADFPREIEAFLGIPYALPPTGRRRFARPQPVNASSLTVDASNYGYRCAASPLSWVAPDWDEDCLNVNVFRPRGTSPGMELPVAVYVHGGAFNSGA